MIIVLEGVDRCGKSTQVNMLYQFFTEKSIKCCVYKFPLDKSILEIENNLMKQVALVNERIRLDKDIREKSKGSIVIIDRFKLSGIAYGMARRLDIKLCESLESKLVEPDITILLYGSIEIFSKRNPENEFSPERIQFLTDVFNYMSSYRNIILVNSDDDVKEVHKNILSKIL